MMPACTGLPPGELISSTTALEPSSSKALRMAATTNSALASAPEAISPLMSTTAVWGALLLALGAACIIAPPKMASTRSNQAKRKKIFQRRAARCSVSAANASFSSTARSQPGSVVGAALGVMPGLEGAAAAPAWVAHKSEAGNESCALPGGLEEEFCESVIQSLPQTPQTQKQARHSAADRENKRQNKEIQQNKTAGSKP